MSEPSERKTDFEVYQEILSIAAQSGSDLLIPFLEQFDPEILSKEAATCLIPSLAILLEKENNNYTTRYISEKYGLQDQQ